jgi:acyl dehydratase
MHTGDILSWTRTFLEADVRAFSRVSGDEGRQHVIPDGQGRLMVQGLLTATLPSKIGGDLSFLAREMIFRFERPVFVGDTIHCQVRIDRLEGAPDYRHLVCSWVCTNQESATVMTGGAQGVILGSSPQALTTES